MNTPHTMRATVSFILLVGFLLIFLEGCTTGATSTTVPSQTTTPTTIHSSPTPTPLPAGTVLYRVDWTHGLSSLPGMHGWKIAQGQLETDTTGSATFTIPYHITLSNYAIEFRLQVVRSLPPYSGDYEIVAPRLTGKDGYHAGVFNLKAPGPRPFGDHPQSQVYLDPYSDASRGSGVPQDYEPGSGWHTYRVEVQDNEVSLLDNGTQVGSASSQQTNSLSNGPVTFNCKLVILRVSDLRILTL